MCNYITESQTQSGPFLVSLKDQVHTFNFRSVIHMIQKDSLGGGTFSDPYV